MIHYRNSLACGHRDWFSVLALSGKEWCFACNRYVVVSSSRAKGRAHPLGLPHKRLSKRR